jgi:hypothetical protein
MKINIHDLVEVGLLRLVSPEEFVEACKQNGIIIKNENYWSEEGRLNFVEFETGEVKIHYQVCGLFAGDEYIIFPKNTPKQLIDKILAVLQLVLAENLVQHHNREVGFIMTPSELVAKLDNSTLDYRNKELNKTKTKIDEALLVLKGKKSYFDSLLKDYKPPKTLGEAIFHIALTLQVVEDTVSECLDTKDKRLKYLVKEYLEWKIKTTGFETLYDSFEDKVKTSYEGLSTKTERGWGELTTKEKVEFSYLKKAISNRKLIEKTIIEGNKILPLLNNKLKTVEVT